MSLSNKKIETKIATRVDETHIVIAWMVHFASVLVNGYEAGHAGNISHETSQEKQSCLLGLEYGGILYFKRAKPSGNLAKLDIRRIDWVFFGRDIDRALVLGNSTSHLSRDDHRARQRRKHSQPSTSWRLDGSPSYLGGTSHGWVPVSTHSTPVPTTVGRLWVAQQQYPHQYCNNIVAAGAAPVAVEQERSASVKLCLYL